MTTERKPSLRYPCWTCKQRGWVSDGQLDDGRLTGRITCHNCDGEGTVSGDVLVKHILDITQPVASDAT